MKKICLVLGIVLLIISAYSVKAIGNRLYFTIQDNKIVYENNNESSHFNPVRDSIRIYSIIIKYSFA